MKTDTLEQIAKEFEETDHKIKESTCWNCSLWRECKFIFDWYNFDGDCIAEK